MEVDFKEMRERHKSGVHCRRTRYGASILRTNDKADDPR